MIARGLAPGIALVTSVSSVSAGTTQAQDKVLKSLYGLGTDMTVTEARSAPGRTEGVSAAMPVDARSRSAHQESKRTRGQAPETVPAAGYACPVSNREIRPSSPTVKVHPVRISPQVSLR